MLLGWLLIGVISSFGFMLWLRQSCRWTYGDVGRVMMGTLCGPVMLLFICLFFILCIDWDEFWGTEL